MHSVANTCPHPASSYQLKINDLRRFLGADQESVRTLSSPVFMTHDQVNASLSDPVFVGEIPLGVQAAQVFRSDLVHLIVRELRASIVGSVKNAGIVLKKARSVGHHVLLILGHVAKFQMLRVHTPSDVLIRAAVQNPFAFRDRPAMQNPTSLVGLDQPLPFSGVWISDSSPNSSMAARVASFSLPQPMRGGDKDALPKTARESLGQTLLSKVLGCNLDLHCSTCPCALLTQRASSFLANFRLVVTHKSREVGYSSLFIHSWGGVSSPVPV